MYIERERERCVHISCMQTNKLVALDLDADAVDDRDAHLRADLLVYVCMYVCVYIYIYIYIER